MRLAVIGGTGVDHTIFAERAGCLDVETPFGMVSVCECEVGGQRVFFLTRHGSGHKVPPHRINYRANIWALRQLKVERIIATAAVGSLRGDLGPGSIVVLDTFLDFTSGRPVTFYDGDDGVVVHTDVTHPYCETLRRLLIAKGQEMRLPLATNGCYVCTNGPRYETAAEVRAFALLGGDVVGMTGVPEVVLAREAGICYASVALVTNYGAGISNDDLSHDAVVRVMQASGEDLGRLLRSAVEVVVSQRCLE